MKPARLLLLAVAGLAFAQSPLSGPVAGYVTAPGASGLRAILGVPGALRFSEPLSAPDGITNIRIAPGQEYALAERAGSAIILSLSAGAIDRAASLDGIIAPADWVA